MKKLFSLVALLGGLLLVGGCASSTKLHPKVMDPELTPSQELELRHRLDQVYVGMARHKVLEVLNLESFGIPVYDDSNSTGTTLSFPKKHTITISTLEGDYDYTLRWVRFDGEMWPQNNEKKK